MTTAIEYALQKVAAWCGRQVQIKGLSGWLTNQNFRLDIDFWAYTMGRWERALEMLDSDDFSRWLADAGRED